MCVPGIGPDGEWPPAAKRLAKLAWAVAYRVRKAAGAVEASMALADDDVMMLCQGLEVLEALEECSGEFFEGKRSKRERHGGERFRLGVGGMFCFAAYVWYHGVLRSSCFFFVQE